MFCGFMQPEPLNIHSVPLPWICMVAYLLPPTCVYFSTDYVNMQDNYVNMQDKYVNMQDNYVNMHYLCQHATYLCQHAR